MTHAVYLQSKAEATARAAELMPSCLWGESGCLCLHPADFLDLRTADERRPPVGFSELELVPFPLSTVVPFTLYRKSFL